MNRQALLVAGLALALSGCIDPSIIGINKAEPSRTTKAVVAQKPPAVHVSQVDESNGHAMAMALEAELEYAAKHDEEVKTPPR